MSEKVQLAPALLAELERRIDSEHPSVEAVISSLLSTSGGKLIGDPLYAYTCSADFRGRNSDSDRYLSLLGKIHEMHREDFQEFVASQSFKRRYFGMSAEEVCEASKHNQARHIEGSKYWAIMNIDAPTKRRFLKRLLVFIGYPDEMVIYVRNLIGTP